MMIPVWVMVLVVGVLLVIAAGVVGWKAWGGGGDHLPACGPLGCIIAAVPVALVVAIVMAVWGWMR